MAAGQRSQIFAVELANMAIDTRVLAHGDLAPVARARLRAKLSSDVGVIGLLARARLQELRRRNPRLLTEIDRLQTAFRQGDQTKMAALIDRLSRRYPVDTTGILPLNEAPARLQAGRALYQNLCMGCHAYPDPASPAPAPDLFAMARSLPSADLVARLIGGVRGTPATTLVNPLSNRQIADLAAYLKAEKSPKNVRR